MKKNDRAKAPRDSREPYEPPRLEKVAIAFEESVLIACKSSGGSGFGSASCGPPWGCADNALS